MTDEKKYMPGQLQDMEEQGAEKPQQMEEQGADRAQQNAVMSEADFVPKGSYPTGLTKPKVQEETKVDPVSPQENVMPAQDSAVSPNEDSMTFAGREGTAPIRVQPSFSEENAAPENASAREQVASAHAPSHEGLMEGQNVEQGEEQAQEAPQEQSAELVELGIAAKMFNHMARFAPIYLFFLFVLHTAASLWLPSTYFPSELQHLELFEQIKQSKQWLLPPITDTLGIAYPAYYWLMTLVDFIPMPETLFLPVLSAITAFIAIYSVYIFGACLKLSKNGAFASALLLLSCPLFVIFLHMAQPEILSMSLFCLALGLLYRGWTKESAPFSFIFGFTFLALATLSGGFLPLWVTFIASILLILWRLDIHRAHKLDAVVGFGFLVLIFAVWMVLVILTSQHANVLDSIMKASIAPFMPPYWPLPLPWWTLIIVCCGLAPWILAPIFSPWLTILKNTLKSLKASRTTNSGPTWLYLTLFCGIAILILQKNDAPLAALPLLPIVGLILGKVVVNLGNKGSSLFFLFFALMLLFVGIACTIFSIPAIATYWEPYLSAQLAQSLKNIYGLPILSALFIISSLILIRFTKRIHAQGAVLVIALFSLLVVQPVVLFVAPSLVGHYTKYHQKGTGLGTVPAIFGMPKADLPTSPAKAQEGNTVNTQEVPAANPAAQDPAIPAIPETGQQPITPPAGQSTGQGGTAPLLEEAPPVAEPMTE